MSKDYPSVFIVVSEVHDQNDSLDFRAVYTSAEKALAYFTDKHGHRHSGYRAYEVPLDYDDYDLWECRQL